MVESALIAYIDETEIEPWFESGWILVGVIVLCGATAVYLRRTVQIAAV